MVSRLLRVSIPTPNPPFSSPESSVSSSGRQLRFELKQAVDRNMVFTRSQDHTPATIDKHNAQAERSILRKRKIQHDADAATPTQPAATRRRASDKTETDNLSTPQFATAVVIEVKKQDSKGTQDLDLPVIEPDSIPWGVTETALPASAGSPRTRGESNIDVGGSPIEPACIDLEDEIRREAVPCGDRKERGQLSVSLKLGRKPNKTKTGINIMKADESSEEPSPEAAREISTTALPSKPPTSIHKRFDSAEPESEALQPQPRVEDGDKDHVEEAANEDTSYEHDASDEDEAPETVTASAGQAQAFTAALEQSKAAARLEEQKKLKRRERDARLKEQAKAAKKEARAEAAPKPLKVKGPAVEEAVEGDSTPISGAEPYKASRGKRSLPALLPEHLLADEPVVQPFASPSPFFSKALTLAGQKKKFLDLEQKPPKDIKKGGVKIRVLRDEGSMLPPKASQQGKALREAWLMGRRGKGTVVERRKMIGQGGFVRR